MGEVFEKEVAQITDNNEALQEKDEYSIANYLKDHHGLLIAITSAIVAVFSFVINIVSYLNVNAYLMYWDIEISQVKLNSSNQIYSVATAFFFQVIILFTTLFMSNTYDSYEKLQEKSMYIKWKQKELSKRIKNVYKELRISERKLKKFKRKSNELEEVEELERLIEHIKNELEQDRKEAKIINKERRKSIKQDVFLLLISIVICFSIIFGGFTILLTTLICCDNIFQYSLFFSLIYVCVNIAIYGGINYFFARNKIKKIIDGDKGEDEHIAYKNLPIEIMILGKWNLIATNKSIKNILLQLVIITIIFVFSFSYAGNSKAKEQKDFQYVASEDETYVVIYNNSEDLILKKAFIDTDNIIIDLSVQKTISARDVTLHKRKFSTVDILRIQ